MSDSADPHREHADPVQIGTDVDQVADAVLSASQLLIELSARSLAAVEDTLTLPQFRMLVMLESRRELSLAQLAEHLSVNPSTASPMTERLVSLGMLARVQRPADPPEAVFVLTHSGRRTVTEVTTRRRIEIAQIVASIPPPRRAELIHALQSFTNSGDEPLATSSTPPIS